MVHPLSNLVVWGPSFQGSICVSGFATPAWRRVAPHACYSICQFKAVCKTQQHQTSSADLPVGDTWLSELFGFGLEIIGRDNVIFGMCASYAHASTVKLQLLVLQDASQAGSRGLAAACKPIATG